MVYTIMSGCWLFIMQSLCYYIDLTCGEAFQCVVACVRLRYQGIINDAETHRYVNEGN
jgi:hypothetical protein